MMVRKMGDEEMLAKKNLDHMDDGVRHINWRYQAVYVEEEAECFKKTSFKICEVYLNEKGELWRWTDPVMPSGENIDELIADLEYMLADASTWKPVVFEDLKEGMVFERRDGDDCRT